MLIDDVMSRIPDEIVAQRVKAKPEHSQLDRNITWAMKKRDTAMLQRFMGQMSALVDNTKAEMAQEIIASMENDGTIVQFVTPAQAVDYAYTKNATMILHEILQSFLLDMRAWYRNQGIILDPDDVNRTEPTYKAINALCELLDKNISQRYKRMKPEIKEAWMEEADADYEYIKQRMRTFEEKIQAIAQKETAK